MSTVYTVENFCPTDDVRNASVQRLLQGWPRNVRSLLRGTRQNQQHWALDRQVRRGEIPSDGYLTVAGADRPQLHTACIVAVEAVLENMQQGAMLPVEMQDRKVLAQVVYDLACPKGISDFKLSQLARNARWFVEFAINPVNRPIILVGYQEAIEQLHADLAKEDLVEAPAVELVVAPQVLVEAPAVELVVAPTVIKPSAPYNGVLGAPLTRSVSDGVFQLQKRNIAMWMNLPPINCKIAEDAEATIVESYKTDLALAKTALAEAQCMGLARYVEMMYRAKELAVIVRSNLSNNTPVDMLVDEFDRLKPSDMETELFLAAWLVARNSLF